MIAFGSNGRIGLICDVTRKNVNGSLSFRVRNGGWDGVYFPDRGEIEFTAPDGEKCHKVEKIWEGDPVGRDYNEWIANIEAAL